MIIYDYEELCNCFQGVKLTSVKTQLPMEFYRAPFCEPEGGGQYKSENLGMLHLI